ncbi:MAG: hypothetical protein AAB601_02835 [Patescibacteria group bacterium]
MPTSRALLIGGLAVLPLLGAVLTAAVVFRPAGVPARAALRQSAPRL